MKQLLLFGLLVSHYLGTSLFGNPASGAGNIFSKEELLEITLTMDIRNLQADRGDSARYHKASLIYTDEGQQTTVSVKIKARGNFRRNPEVCEFPPLRVKISEKNRAGTLFSNHKKLKLVTACQNDELVLKEYLIYKHFALLSPYSFQVRLTKILLKDSDGVVEDREMFAFFIEDDEQLADRLGGYVWEGKNLLPADSYAEQLGLLYVFQYKIGNTDWDIYTGKNIKLIQIAEISQPIAVPYDFDWSKVCDAPYTDLEESFERRKFKPLCLTASDFEAIHARFDEKREEIYALYKDFPYLKNKNFRVIKTYFNAFYKTLDDPGAVEHIFLNNCESVTSKHKP